MSMLVLNGEYQDDWEILTIDIAKDELERHLLINNNSISLINIAPVYQYGNLFNIGGKR
jgi:hypothetical protein